MKIGNDKETSELLYSTLFCHFKEPLLFIATYIKKNGFFYTPSDKNQAANCSIDN